MSEKDVVENVDSLGEISIPIATNSEPGIASFDSNDFTVGADGKVNSIVGRGIPQYLGKITGTGTGTTDLNWEVDWKSRPTIDAGTANEEVDKAKRIKIGEYIMLTEHFNQFVPGDIFRITNVQIEGSAYTVKTNNVRALSLASIIGPQGKQGEQGEQGVSYLAYTNNIVDTVDPVISTPMYLTDGAFNRTPAKSDAVTVDWYNSTTHRAFMVTGIISDRASAGRWVALITAITDITGAVGPQGKEGAGIGDIVDIDYPHGEFTSVQYDTDDGIKLQGIAQYLRDDGETYQIPTDIDIPLVAGEGISIDKKDTEAKVEVKIDTSVMDARFVKKVQHAAPFLYAGGANGDTIGYLSTTPNANNIPQYSDSATLQTNAPVNAKDAANKQWVEAQIAAKARGEKVSLTFPAGASSGTLTDEQLATLQASEANYIEMVNDKELYYLNDNGHVDGYLTYSHIGIENSKATIKTLTITVSAKSFVIVTTVVPTDAGGGKLYRHRVSYYDTGKYNKFSACFYTSDNIRYNNFTKLFDLAAHLDYIPLYEFGAGESGKITSTHYIPNSLYVVNDKLIALGYKSGVAAQDAGNVIFTVDSDIDIIDTITEV